MFDSENISKMCVRTAISAVLFCIFVKTKIMEILLHDIITKLEENMDDLGLSYIDEDFGQLEAIDIEEDTYPMTFPAVLVNVQTTSWEGVGGANQTGSTNISVKLLVDCYDDTHARSTRTDRIMDRSALSHKLTAILHGAKLCDNTTMLTRISSNSYNGPHLIKVYETTYSSQIIEVFDKPVHKEHANIRIVTRS